MWAEKAKWVENRCERLSIILENTLSCLQRFSGMNELSWKKTLFKNTKSQALSGTVGETCQNVRLTNWTSFKRFEGQLMKTREKWDKKLDFAE